MNKLHAAADAAGDLLKSILDGGQPDRAGVEAFPVEWEDQRRRLRLTLERRAL